MDTVRIDKRSGEAREIQFCEQWLANGIDEDYQDWHIYDGRYHRRATHVLIQSATRTGKTGVMLDKLCPFAAKQGRNVLYLGNRTALEEQTKNVIRRSWEQKGEELSLRRSENGPTTIISD